MNSGQAPGPDRLPGAVPGVYIDLPQLLALEHPARQLRWPSAIGFDTFADAVGIAECEVRQLRLLLLVIPAKAGIQCLVLMHGVVL